MKKLFINIEETDIESTSFIFISLLNSLQQKQFLDFIDEPLELVLKFRNIIDGEMGDEVEIQWNTFKKWIKKIII